MWGINFLTFISSETLTEAINILDKTYQMQPILTLFTDAGAAHRPTILSVEVALIALFCHVKLDMVVAAHTAPDIISLIWSKA